MTNEQPPATPSEVIRALAVEPPSAIVSEEWMAKTFNRHKVSIKRAVDRGELPPPVRMFGKPVWLVGEIIHHMEGRLARERDEQKRLQRVVSISERGRR